MSIWNIICLEFTFWRKNFRTCSKAKQVSKFMLWLWIWSCYWSFRL